MTRVLRPDLGGRRLRLLERIPNVFTRGGEHTPDLIKKSAMLFLLFEASDVPAMIDVFHQVTGLQEETLVTHLTRSVVGNGRVRQIKRKGSRMPQVTLPPGSAQRQSRQKMSR